MKLTVFGATGRIGELVVRQALDAGHKVTAVARDSARFELRHPALEVVAVPGLTDAEVLRPALDGSDAVISGVGPRGRKDGPVASTATRAILRAMAASDVSRLVAVSAAPVGPVPPGDSILNRRLMPVRMLSPGGTGPTGAALTATNRLTSLAAMARRIGPGRGRGDRPSLRAVGRRPRSRRRCISAGRNTSASVRPGHRKPPRAPDACSSNRAESRATAVAFCPASSAPAAPRLTRCGRSLRRPSTSSGSPVRVDRLGYREAVSSAIHIIRER